MHADCSLTRRAQVIGVATALAAAVWLPAPARAQSAPEIGGFRLGQDREAVEEAIRAPLGDGQCAFARVEGADYRYRFTPAGRLYRIETRRELGALELGEAFRTAFVQGMVDRYGPPDLAEAHSGFVRMIWGAPGGTRRVVKLAPSATPAGAGPIVLREDLSERPLLEADRAAAARPAEGDPRPPTVEPGDWSRPSSCRGLLRPSRVPSPAP